MDYEALLNFYNELTTLVQVGDDAKVQEAVAKRFGELPEDVQGELLTRMYLKGMQEKVEESDTLAAIQEEGLAALETLEILKKKIEQNPAAS